MYFRTSFEITKASQAQPDKDSEEAEAEQMLEKGNDLLFQKKAMRLLKNDVQNIMNTQAQKGDFQAFKIEDESIDKKVIKIPFNEQDSMIKIGRIAIKNRVKSFNIDVHKYNMLFSSFKIELISAISIWCFGSSLDIDRFHLFQRLVLHVWRDASFCWCDLFVCALVGVDSEPAHSLA